MATNTTKVGVLKPFNIADKKDPDGRVSEVTANKWQGCILQNLRKEPKWIPLLELEWGQKKVANRGVHGRPEVPGPPLIPAVPAATVATDIDSMLEYISQYSPNCLYRDITQRVTSLQAIWILIRKWAGLKSSGCRLHAYWLVRRNYDPNGDASPTDLFYELRNAMEDSLLRTRASGGTVRHNGEFPTEDEDLTPTLESTVVGDWLATLGGAALQDLVIRVYAKDLETESLADLRERITDNLETLMAEAAQPSLASTATVSWTRTNQQYPRPRAPSVAPTNRRWHSGAFC